MKKVMSIVILVIAVAVIGMGVVWYVTAPDESGAYYSTSDVTFGADFYTYMYEASDTIVDALDDIENNTNQAAVKEAQGDAMIMITVGLAILAFGLHGIADAFGKKNAPALAPVTAPAYGYTQPTVATDAAYNSKVEQANALLAQGLITNEEYSKLISGQV